MIALMSPFFRICGSWAMSNKTALLEAALHIQKLIHDGYVKGHSTQALF